MMLQIMLAAPDARLLAVLDARVIVVQAVKPLVQLPVRETASMTARMLAVVFVLRAVLDTAQVAA